MARKRTMATKTKEIQGYKGKIRDIHYYISAVLMCFILVLPLKIQSSSTVYHELFIKEHSLYKQEPDKPIGRTLFIANVPPYSTEASFKQLFSCAGKIESVTFQTIPGSAFKTAYIVFTTPAALENALKLNKLQPLSTNKHKLTLGVEKWTQEYNATIYDREKLQKQVNDFMEQYDKEEERRKQKEKQEKMDSEGWTVVTKKGRNPGISRKESVGNKISEKLERTSKKKELKNFYTFQIRESKMNHIVKLRQKFEEDKKKIAAFKQSRRFKPF